MLFGQEETEEAVRAGNKKYNEMLAERMRMEDELRDKIQVGLGVRWCTAMEMAVLWENIFFELN